MVVAVCAVACLSVRVSPSRGGLPLCHACVWAENDSRVVWFVKLGVSWLRFAMLSVVGSGFVPDISY